MSFKGNINEFRRKLTKGLTKGIGKKINPSAYKNINPLAVNRILISRPNNRLGNQLMITPLVQELSLTFPNAKIDLFVRGTLSTIIFKNYDNVDKIYDLPRKPFKQIITYLSVWIKLYRQRYDVAINIVNNSSSGRLSTSLARAKYKFFGDNIPELEAKFPDYNHMAKKAVYNLRYFLNDFKIDEQSKEVLPLNIKLTSDESKKGKELLDELVKNNKKTIGIYTFATGSKCYCENKWGNMYSIMFKEFSAQYNIVEVLPIENCSQINFKAPSYYSKDIREIAGFLDNLDLFVTADCGIMHLGCSTSVPLLGLFSRDNLATYTPYGTNKTGINTDGNDKDVIIQKMKKLLQ